MVLDEGEELLLDLGDGDLIFRKVVRYLDGFAQTFGYLVTDPRAHVLAQRVCVQPQN